MIAKRKLLFVVNVDWFFMSHRLPIAMEALRQGFEVHVATGLTDRREAMASLGLQVHELPLARSGTSVLGELRTFRRMLAVMRQVRPDVAHLVTVKPVLLGGIAARLARVPSVLAAVSGLGFVFTSRGAMASMLRAVVLLLYRMVQGHPNMKVVFQNEDDQRVLQRLTGLDESRTVVIHGSGVDLDEFAVRPFPAGPVAVLFAARLLHDKGIVEFLEATRILRDKGVHAVFRLAGAPDAENRASVSQEDLREWEQAGHAQFLGHRDDMAEVLSDAHVVVLPSYREGLPKVLVEAAACGRPVVTTDVPGCRDAVIPDVTGLLVPARDARALASAIERLVMDAAMRTEMGAAARQLAEREFGISHIVGQHLALYRQLLAAAR
ncbi:MAG: glycosyltransferase family 4 protein [Ramlibacter sp.]